MSWLFYLREAKNYTKNHLEILFNLRIL
jgi:hypothetical protein